jgi:RNA polymerase sigma-70 factor (ECF subfamily)
MDDPIEQEVIALHREHAPGLLRHAVSLVGDQDAARDAVQEVFLRYFVERRYGRAIENPPAWLYQVLRNYLIDRLKAFPMHRQVGPQVLDSLPAKRNDPEKTVRDCETARQIAETLTARELNCLRLRAEGLSYGEIAAAMNIRPGTVGALLARVHQKLEQSDASPQKKSVLEIAHALPYLVWGKWAYSS